VRYALTHLWRAELALLLLLAAAAAPAQAQPLANGDLSKGAGNFPDHWQTQAWQEGPGFSNFQWIHSPGHPGELRIDSTRPNDARWMQSMTLAPGWYHFSVEARTQNVGALAAGAAISVLEDGITSPQLKGTMPWQRIGFYLKVGRRGADIELALRLGGFSSTNTGSAFFRDVRMEQLKTPPAGAGPVYDLDQIRREGQELPVGRPWTLVATYLALLVIAYMGWRAYGESAAPAQDSREQNAPPRRRSARQ
jgi:hypothetical protein